MRNTSNDKKSPTDPAAAHIEFRLYPYKDDTAASVVLVRGLGARSVRLLVWTGHLDCRRADLVGSSARDVAILLCGQLSGALRRTYGEAVAQAADTSGAAAPAPLEGPQGVSEEQLSLSAARAPGVLHAPGPRGKTCSVSCS